MFGFRRKKKEVPTRREESATASSFVDATNGGWTEAPAVIAADGGSHADFVAMTLQNAQQYGIEQGAEIGDGFTFTLTDIPTGIVSPHEIIFGLMMRGHEYGLSVQSVHDETISIVRIA